jgi:hypothetical protein
VRRKLAINIVVAAPACLLVFKATVAVLVAFPDYFPANFRSDLLLGRHGYFIGSYHWAFYAHVVAGPLTLIPDLSAYRKLGEHALVRVGMLGRVDTSDDSESSMARPDHERLRRAAHPARTADANVIDEGSGTGGKTCE